MSFSKNIKALRLSKGLSQEAFAEKLGKERTCISKWESGKSSPSRKTLAFIAETFNTTLIELCRKD